MLTNSETDAADAISFRATRFDDKSEGLTGWSVETQSLRTNEGSWISPISSVAIKLNLQGKPLPDPGVTAFPVDLDLAEGSSDSYALALARPPAYGDTVSITVNDPTDNSDVTATASSVSFTLADWNVAKRVIVEAAQDTDAVDDSATITHSVTGDGDWGSLNIPDVKVAVVDDEETQPRVFYEMSSYTVAEGTSRKVTVRLSGAAASALEIPITATAQGGAMSADYTITPANVSFAEGESEQSITVVAPDDSIDDDGKGVELGFGTLPSGVIAGVRGTAVVSIADDDVLGLVLPPTSLSLTEGLSGSYTVALDREPAEMITVAVVVPDGADLSLEPDTLTFATGAWSNAQTVTVTANKEGNAADDNYTISHSLSGGVYNGDESAGLLVPVTDRHNALAGNLTFDSSEIPFHATSAQTRGSWFDTGPANHDWLLASIVLDIAAWHKSVTPTVTLHEDDAGYTEDVVNNVITFNNFRPGTLIATMSNPARANGDETGQLIFAAPADTVLEPDTRYVIVVTSEGGSPPLGLW